MTTPSYLSGNVLAGLSLHLVRNVNTLLPGHLPGHLVALLLLHLLAFLLGNLDGLLQEISLLHHTFHSDLMVENVSPTF